VREPPLRGADSGRREAVSNMQKASICMPINVGEAGADFTVVPMTARL
jgi:hypothetical protein